MIILPIFDSAKHIEEQKDFSYLSDDYNMEDIRQVHSYLKLCVNSSAFNHYRKIEALLHWCALVAKISLKDFTYNHFKDFLLFYSSPEEEWISHKKSMKFKTNNSIRIPNPEWKPFTTMSRNKYKDLINENVYDHKIGKSLISNYFIFFNFLVRKEYLYTNPIKNNQCQSRFINTSLNNKLILPIFDTAKHIEEQSDFSYLGSSYSIPDIKEALEFLRIKKKDYAYIHIRVEIERFLHWCAIIAKITLKKISYICIEKYIEFYENPPKDWIDNKRKRKFYYKGFIRVPNPEWKPFTISNLKSRSRENIFLVLNEFFAHLIQKKYIYVNPFINKMNNSNKTKCLVRSNEEISEIQWEYIHKNAIQMAKQDPDLNERTLFIISAIHLMSLQLSELIPVNKNNILKMNNFFCDNINNWWFKSVERKNKDQYVFINNEMLAALKRWREHLGFGPYPSSDDNKPLFPKKVIGSYISSLTSISYIRRLVNDCIFKSSQDLLNDKFIKEANSLKKINFICTSSIKSEEAKNIENKTLLSLKKMYTEGKMSNKEIYNSLKISEATFYKYKKLLSLEQNKKSIIKKQKILSLKRMYAEGKMTNKEIYNALRIPEGTFYRYLLISKNI